MAATDELYNFWGRKNLKNLKSEIIKKYNHILHGDAQ